MISEYDRVRIKKSGVEGIVVDVRNISGRVRYLIESDNEKTDGLFDCEERELEKL